MLPHIFVMLFFVGFLQGEFANDCFAGRGVLMNSSDGGSFEGLFENNMLINGIQ